MRIFLASIALFVLSLLFLTKTYRYLKKRPLLHQLLVKHQAATMLILILVIILVPFILLLISTDISTPEELANIFLMSLLISAIFAILVERVRMSIFQVVSDKDKISKNPPDHAPAYVPESDWRSTIEQKTLERFGLNSSIGVPPDTIDRLGNALMVPLSQAIDALEDEPA